MSVQVHVHRDAEAAAFAAAKRFIEVGRSAIQQRGRFSAALAGGTTPIRMYETLAEAPRFSGPRTSPCEAHREKSQQLKPEGRSLERDASLDWGLVHVFFIDERCVAPDHVDSNYAMVSRCLLDRVDVPECQVHRIESELTPCELAAERYESMLRTFFCVGDGRAPRGSTFDLVLLGVGADGHVASLFPGGQAVTEEPRWVVCTQAPESVEPRDRITLTLQVINAARRVIFLVSGANKAHIVRPLLAGLGDPGWPATWVRCAGSIEWHVDEAAAGITPVSART